MRIERLDHVNIVTTKLSEMATWYEEVLGLKLGPALIFRFPELGCMRVITPWFTLWVTKARQISAPK